MNNLALERTLILARHGQTAWNLAGRYQGHSDPPLCEIGKLECATLASQLLGRGIRSIITSPLLRAQETAQIIAHKLAIHLIKIDSRLTEVNFGAWEGLTQVEVKRYWPAILQTWKTEPDTVRFPGGETLQEARNRLRAVLRDLAQSTGQAGFTTLLVTHTGLIRLAVQDCSEPRPTYRHIEVPPGSMRAFTLRSSEGATDPILENASLVS